MTGQRKTAFPVAPQLRILLPCEVGERGSSLKLNIGQSVLETQKFGNIKQRRKITLEPSQLQQQQQWHWFSTERGETQRETQWTDLVQKNLRSEKEACPQLIQRLHCTLVLENAPCFSTGHRELGQEHLEVAMLQLLLQELGDLGKHNYIVLANAYHVTQGVSSRTGVKQVERIFYPREFRSEKQRGAQSAFPFELGGSCDQLKWFKNLNEQV